MEINERDLNKQEKGISIEACLDKANLYIEENGACLFVMDIVNSRAGGQNTREEVNRLLGELNSKFEEHLPENDLAAPGRQDKGFNRVLGDGILAGISSSHVVAETASYIKENYGTLSLHYNVAADGYDDDGIRTLK